MAKVRWTSNALKNISDISVYWTQRNKSTAYARKLNRLFQLNARELAAMPYLGKAAGIPGIRMKLVLNYWIFYKIEENGIAVLQIKSTHQDPESFYKHL